MLYRQFGKVAGDLSVNVSSFFRLYSSSLLSLGQVLFLFFLVQNTLVET